MQLNDLDKERIAILKDLNLVTNNSLKMFDDITALAAETCKTPIALISFLTEKEQFFKSRFGLDVVSTPIEQSFCHHAIKTPNKLFEVEDATTDERFKDTALVCGTPNITSYYGAPIKSKNGVVLGTLCVIDSKKNILTDSQKKILKKLANQIEYLIEFLATTKKLKEHQDNLVINNNDMEDFLAMAVHDLKSPLRGINSFTTIIKKKYHEIWDVKDVKYFNFIESSISKMTELIGSVIEYSKINNIAYVNEEFSLEELVEDIFADLTFNFKKQPVLMYENLPKVKSSKIAFDILFKNLISNALKYTNTIDNVIIKISHVDSEQNWIFKIEDNGIGIEKKFFEEIFKPFKRLHTSSQFEGSGLGLSNCKNIIDKLNGTITVTSNYGEGSAFTIKIPKP